MDPQVTLRQPVWCSAVQCSAADKWPHTDARSVPAKLISCGCFPGKIRPGMRLDLLLSPLITAKRMKIPTRSTYYYSKRDVLRPLPTTSRLAAVDQL